MVKDGLKITALAGMFFVYPAFADNTNLKPETAKNLAPQEQPMDKSAPDASFQDASDGDDRRTDLQNDNQLAYSPPENLAKQAQPAYQQPAPAPDTQQHKGDSQLAYDAQQHQGDSSQLAYNGATPQANIKNQSTLPPDEQHQGDNVVADNLSQLPPSINQDAPHRDYQAPHKAEDEQHGQELSEAELKAYENDQQQYEQAQATMNQAPDQRGNELNARISQEQNKLQSDSASNNSTAVEDDKQSLALDKQELNEQELAASNHTENLEEFNDPNHQEMPNTETQVAEAAPPAEPAAPPQNTELALNKEQTPRVPW
ncbi:MAG: hypothetical protein V4501_01160 [Pseudomonadota bacterium]